MVRQLLVAAVVVIGLAGCGVGADEDIAVLEQSLHDRSSSQEPIPPPEAEPVVIVVRTAGGAPVVLAVGGPAPASPGAENSSSQDPIPPKYLPTRLAGEPTRTESDSRGGVR